MEREVLNIPRTGDVIQVDFGDAQLKRQKPHNSIPKVMKAVDYQLIRTEYGTYLALSNEHINKLLGFGKAFDMLLLQ